MVEVVANSLNSPTSTLSSGVTSGSASLPVVAPTAPDAWPTPGTFRVKCELELIAVTAASGGATSLTVVSRGVEGTTAAAHSTGAGVNMVDTAASQAARFLAASETIDQIAAANATAADWSNNSNKITSVKDPTAAQDAATKNYVDVAVNGLDWKAAARLATTAALPPNLYSNGASGVGATLTGLSTGVLSIDGVAVVVGDRVLVKNEAAPANNGIYVVTTIGTSPALYVLTRAADYNQASEIQAGDAVYVVAGTANVDTSWVMTTTTTPFVVGSTGMVWTQFGGNLVSSVFGRTGAVVAATNDYSEAQLSFTDITTNNVGTSKHGFAPKAPNDATKFFDGTGSYSSPPGHEIGYDQITVSVTVSSATEATGTTVISAAAHTFDGGAVIASFFSPAIAAGAADVVIVCLFESSTEIGRFGGPQGGSTGALFGEIRFTPSAGAHTYTVTAFRISANGTIFSGAFGAGVYSPTFVRFTKV